MTITERNKLHTYDHTQAVHSYISLVVFSLHKHNIIRIAHTLLLRACVLNNVS